MTKYEKRLIATNAYYYALMYNKSSSKAWSYYALVDRYLCKHLPSYSTDAIVDLVYSWTIQTFNHDMCYILHRNPMDVINQCNQYGINLEDIKNLQGYIN